MFQKQKNIIIAGCGRFGSSIAGKLSQLGHHVIIIDKFEEAFRRLPDTFSGYQVVGDAANAEFLERIDIKNCFLFIASTDSDNANCLISLIAKNIYKIEKVYAKLDDAEKQILIEDSDVDAIYPSLLSINEFQKLSGIDFKEEL